MEIEIETTTTAKPKLTLERLLQMIEEKGAADILDLSGQDLSYLDLSTEIIEATMYAHGYLEAGPKPPWIAPFTWGKNLHGINLRHANLQDADLKHANLRGADLSGANLKKADLRDACLQYAALYQADLRAARLWRADLREVSATNANFSGASLYRVNLENGELDGANLQNAWLEGANLADVRISRECIGEKLLQEHPTELYEFIKRDYPGWTPGQIDKFYTHRHERTKRIYRELVSSFSRHGYRDDASWAYYRERMYERKMHGPTQARRYYGDEVAAKDKNNIWHWLWFYLRHFGKWLLLWASELSCGYGERPARTAFLVVVIVPLFAVLFRLSEGVAASNGAAMTGLDYVNYSFGAFATVGFARFITVNALAEALTSIEALFGIATLALLMFALGNRISRS